jgi:acetate CoA/acetoacetate CoA-transferase alpha subunit
MATAADYVVAETERLVRAGEIDPNEVMLPGLFVDAIVIGEASHGKRGES